VFSAAFLTAVFAEKQDKNRDGDEKHAEEKFKQIAAAYEVLSDQNKREVYEMKQFSK
jgi:DnaJ-class molecular chaperone